MHFCEISARISCRDEKNSIILWSNQGPRSADFPHCLMLHNILVSWL